MGGGLTRSWWRELCARQYDPVSEYVKALQSFQRRFELSERSLVKIIVQLSRFFTEFSHFMSSRKRLFLHPKVFGSAGYRTGSTCKSDDLLARIGILDQLRAHGLHGSSLDLSCAPKSLQDSESVPVKKEPVAYAFEVSARLDGQDRYSEISHSIRNLRRSAETQPTEFTLRVDAPELICDGSALAPDHGHYFYRRWLWVVFPWACLHVGESQSFSQTMSHFKFDQVEHLTGESISTRGRVLGREHLQRTDRARPPDCLTGSCAGKRLGPRSVRYRAQAAAPQDADPREEVQQARHFLVSLQKAQADSPKSEHELRDPSPHANRAQPEFGPEQAGTPAPSQPERPRGLGATSESVRPAQIRVLPQV